MTDKQIILDGVDVLKEKINMCFILLLNKLETSETIEQTIYEHLDAFIEDWNKQLVDKEQECETLASQLDFEVQKKECLEKKCKQQSWDIGNLGYKIKNQRHEINNRLKQLDQLKAEVKSKTEYIQEQRDIINQYSKEIEMYKKCQGKRASKREEELKAENEHLAEKEKEVRHYLKEAYKYRKTLTDIKEIAESCGWNFGSEILYKRIEQILQKIRECEVE